MWKDAHRLYLPFRPRFGEDSPFADYYPFPGHGGFFAFSAAVVRTG